MNGERPSKESVSRWQFCAPLHDYWGEPLSADPPVAFSAAVDVGYALDWYKNEARHGDLFEDPESPIAINGRYEESSVRDVLFAPSPGMDEATEMCRHLPVAVWCVRPSPFAVGKVVFRQSLEREGDFPASAWIHVQPIRPLAQYRRNKLERSHLEAAVPLFTAMMGLPRDGTLWASLRIVRKALAESAVDLRIVLLWVALEGLFGVGQGELQFRLSTHLALYLGANNAGRREIASQARRLYKERSKVVHGSRSAGLDWDEISKDCAELEELVRGVLTKILSGADREVFDRPGAREAFLEGLVLDRPS